MQDAVVTGRHEGTDTGERSAVTVACSVRRVADGKGSHLRDRTGGLPYNLGFAALRAQIEQEMLARQVFIAVFSPSAAVSKWVPREIDEAIALQDREPERIVLPVVAALCDIPPLLSGFKWLSGPGGAPLSATEAQPSW